MLADGLHHAVFFRGHQLPPRDPPPDAIQKFEPVLDRRLLHRLPLVEALLACKETILPTVVCHINVPLGAVLQCAFKSDFCFGHGRWLLSTPKNPNWPPPSPNPLDALF